MPIKDTDMPTLSKASSQSASRLPIPAIDISALSRLSAASAPALLYMASSIVPAFGQCTSQTSGTPTLAVEECVAVSIVGAAFSDMSMKFLPEYSVMQWRSVEHDGYTFDDGSRSYAF